jgi:LEA14-like dessication related protein
VIRFILNAGLLGIGALGYVYYKRQLNLAKETEVKVKSVKVRSATVREALLNFDLVVVNKSKYVFTMQGYDLAMTLNGTYIGRYQAKGLNYTIQPNGRTSKINLNVSFDPLFLGRAIFDVVGNLFRDKKIVLEVKGKITGSMGIIAFSNIPIDYIYDSKED